MGDRQASSRTCNSCNRTFSKPEHLRRHARSHTGERPFHCLICGRKYARRDVLSRHIRGHQRDELEKGVANTDPRYISSYAATEDAAGEPNSPSSFSRKGLQELDGINTSTLPDLPLLSDSLDLLAQVTSLDLDMLEESIFSHDPIFHQTPSGQSTGGISDKQFERIEKLWPTSRKTRARSPSLVCWDEVVLHPADNLFSTNPTENVGTDGSLSEELDSAWHFTHGCRSRLAQHCQRCIKECNVRDSSVARGSTSDTQGLSTGLSDPDQIPSADILDLCLDLYFYHFHHTYPVVHPPTFNASQTPSSLLFPMCLIGLLIMNRKTGIAWADKYLLAALENCCIVLSSDVLDHCPAPELMAILAEACLLSIVAFIVADIVPDAQRSRLQREMISVASRRGLFEEITYSPDWSRSLTTDDLTWKAWARINSGMRVIAVLVVIDAQSAQSLQSLPQSLPFASRIPIICDDEAFNMSGSEEWSISPERPAYSLPLVNQNRRPSAFGLQAVLARIWVQILSERHRLIQALGISDNPLRQPVSGNELFSAHEQATSIASNLVDLYTHQRSEFMSGNANPVILWNFLGLHLTSNLSVIESAAGRDGAAAAREAAGYLAAWATSPIARRACLHAAQVFVAATHQSRSDGTPLHTEMALFTAALVLGIYLALAPEPIAGIVSRGSRAYDLLKEIDWSKIGTEGLCTSPQALSDYAPCEFIRNGGPVSFLGTRFRSSSGMARRIFLNFSARLKELGGWKAKEYCKVLQVLADTMLEV